MDMAFDLDGTVPEWRGEGVTTPALHPRWPDLLARLIAAREASASFAREIGSETIAMRGSFDEVAASCVLAHAARRRSVNPNALGNRKSDGAMASTVAGLTRTGGRG